MTDSADDSKDLLSALDMGPAWAREKSGEKRFSDHPGDRGSAGRQGKGGGRGAGGDRDPRGRESRQGRQGGERGRGRSQREGGGRDRGGPRDLPPPADGVRVTLLPSGAAVQRIAKEIQHRARVHSLFDVAKLFLGARERYQLKFAIEADQAPAYRGKKDDSLFLSKAEATAHFFDSELFRELYETEETEVDPPTGNFQVVARCGLSGEWLGPPNYHGYQSALRQLHRAKFANMPFDRYAARVKTERGEEAVQAWLETMKCRRRWRPLDREEWTFDRTEIERDFATRKFPEVFDEVRETVLPGEVPARHLSERLLASVKGASQHARRHPAMLIPTICQMLESDHLAIFKKQGKLYCGPARPHPLTDYDKLSERPREMVRWLDAHPEAKLADLWQALLPAEAETPPKEWLVDLFWLLTQGHVLLFADSKLVLPKKRHPNASPATPPAKAAKAKEKRPGKSTSRPPDSTQVSRPHPEPQSLKIEQPPLVPPHGGTVRRITHMQPGALKSLRGEARIWSRRLARRERIPALLEEDGVG